MTTKTTNFQDLPYCALVRLKELRQSQLVPFSVSTLWRKVSAGTFPSPVRVSARIIAWRVGDLNNWIESLGGQK